jgi:ABC-type transport system substrate-binding protein
MFEKFAGALVLLIVSVGLTAAEEFGAMITKVDGDNVTFYKTVLKPGEKPQKGEAVTLSAKNAKVYEGKIQFNKETKMIEIVPGDAIEDGLKNEVFKLVGKASIAVRITTSDDNKSITRILALKPGAKK